MQPQPRLHSPILSVLQDSNFRAIWFVVILKEIARWFEILVLSWLVLEATNSPLQLALVWVFNNGSRPLISPFSGVIADRFSRHRIILLSQSLNALTATGILLLLVSDQIQPWHVFIAVSFQGVAKSLDDPSRRTAILDIVGPRRVVNAMSLENMGNNMGKVVGPFLGGLLLSLVGFDGAYGFALVFHLLGLALLTRVKIPRYRGMIGVESVWRGLAISIQYAFHSRTLLGVLYISMFMNGLAFPVQQFIPAIGRDHLEVGPALVGLLVSAWGFGMLVGAGVMASTQDIRFHGRIFVVGSMLCLVMVPLFVWSPWYATSFALLTFAGIANSGFSTMQGPIALLSTPQEMRGRMIGLLDFCISVGIPLGTLEIGLAATVIGTQSAISLNILAAMLLFIPALVFTPLAWKPLGEPLPQRT